jgi:hypothetical protein
VSTEFCFFHPRRPAQGVIKSTLNRRALSVILSAIQDAWEVVESFPYAKSQAFTRAHLQDEDELSTKLMEILNYRLDHNQGGRFNKKRFQTVVRDGKQSTANVASFDQMPDLVIRTMKGAAGEDRDESALFIEAKLVDSGRGCRAYVVEGLHRFVSGRYAPRVTFGLMLGYATKDYAEVNKHLPIYYALATSKEAKACVAPIAASSVHAACFETQHTRSSPCPPDFRALHVWLVRP